jgi:tRNA modification GTPase
MSTLIEDTIAAISTPLGRGGIGVIRLSGLQAKEIAERLLPTPRKLKNRDPLFCTLQCPRTGQELDQAVLTFFEAPRSYTRENVVEISCHGSPVLLQAVLRCLLQQGARLATPGEFTLRAFLHGRIDLLQAEAIRDLIEAKTLYQAKIAHQQATGSLSRKIRPIKQLLVDLIARLEVGIDFAEDDVDVISSGTIEKELDEIIDGLQILKESFDFGKLLSEGMTIAILGRPNVGKSSLFNALLSQDRAIVTEFAGTTRDIVAETTQICGIPVRLQDTAGIRDGGELVEQIGIEKTFEALADADLLLLVLDGSVPFLAEDCQIMKRLENRPFHLVINKADLPHKVHLETVPKVAKSVAWVSALTGQGIEDLKNQLVPEFNQAATGMEENGLVTNLRQQQLVTDALQKTVNTKHSTTCRLPHEILLFDLYTALRALNALTGETTIEDILGNIFSKFCIGK